MFEAPRASCPWRHRGSVRIRRRRERQGASRRFLPVRAFGECLRGAVRALLGSAKSNWNFAQKQPFKAVVTPTVCGGSMGASSALTFAVLDRRSN